MWCTVCTYYMYVWVKVNLKFYVWAVEENWKRERQFQLFLLEYYIPQMVLLHYTSYSIHEQYNVRCFLSIGKSTDFSDTNVRYLFSHFSDFQIE